MLDLIEWIKKLEEEKGNKSSITLIIVNDQITITGTYKTNGAAFKTLTKAYPNEYITDLYNPKFLFKHYRKEFLKA